MMNRTIFQCKNCRSTLLNTFADLAGISIPKRNVIPLRPSSCLQSRTFGTSSQIRSPLDEQENQDTPQNEPPTITTTSTSSNNSSLPWYLQIPNPTPPVPTNSTSTQQALAAQELPEIPHDSPKILLPILTHLSTTIGLDNLTLLDLRHLSNPPPALGSNLIMIIGTARSTKHLNVSADRFSRWCRAEHRLKPYADGLLGRNELKLKLRRKARRLKLAQSVGNTTAFDEHASDDGITTGWICVNLGIVEDIHRDANIEHTSSSDGVQGKGSDTGNEDEYTGFGSQSTASRIVVQMFTESKRAEMDLEELWDIRKTRRRKKEELVKAKEQVETR